MECFICTNCGTQHAPAESPPSQCRVCSDDRQYVAHTGQGWTTHDELTVRLHARIEPDDGLLGIGITEPFAIPQRALLVQSRDIGNVLWDCTSVVTPDAVATLGDLGGIDLIAISHPHFYASMVEWSDAFGGIPIFLHDADRQWIRRTTPAIRTWRGDRLALSDTVSLIHLPGHFPGSAALHWTDAPNGRTVLLAGDSLHVAADHRHVSVMHSVPNYIPVGPRVISDVQHRLNGVDFDDLYGFTWGLNIISGARDAVDQSLDRYAAVIADR